VEERFFVAALLRMTLHGLCSSPAHQALLLRFPKLLQVLANLLTDV